MPFPRRGDPLLRKSSGSRFFKTPRELVALGGFALSGRVLAFIAAVDGSFKTYRVQLFAGPEEFRRHRLTDGGSSDCSDSVRDTNRSRKNRLHRWGDLITAEQPSAAVDEAFVFSREPRSRKKPRTVCRCACAEQPGLAVHVLLGRPRTCLLMREEAQVRPLSAAGQTSGSGRALGPGTQ